MEVCPLGGQFRAGSEFHAIALGVQRDRCLPRRAGRPDHAELLGGGDEAGDKRPPGLHVGQHPHQFAPEVAGLARGGGGSVIEHRSGERAKERVRTHIALARPAQAGVGPRLPAVLDEDERAWSQVQVAGAAPERGQSFDGDRARAVVGEDDPKQEERVVVVRFGQQRQAQAGRSRLVNRSQPLSAPVYVLDCFRSPGCQG